VSREAHAPFYESLGVRFPRATLPFSNHAQAKRRIAPKRPVQKSGSARLRVFQQTSEQASFKNAS
jgi:hypothetical protein